MREIRRILTATVVAASMAAVAAPAFAGQSRRDQERRKQAEQREAQVVLKVLDAVAAGKEQPPADLSVTWVQHYVMKAAEGADYIPFTLSIDRSRMSRPNAALYVRAVSKNAPPPPAPKPPAPGEYSDSQRRAPAPAPVYAWEDIQLVEVGADGMLSRAMMLKPGEYDVVVFVKEAAAEGRNQPPPKMGLLRRTLTVKDLNGPDLVISTPLFAESAEPLPTPLSIDDQRVNPYTFGGTLKVVPLLQPKFKTSGELQLLFYIYGSQHTNGVPDLTIDYNFHQKTADGEKFFNKTAPQAMNASTLPPGFNMTTGHQVLGFLGIPLKSFPAGDYRVELKITDKLSGKTLTENVTFTVES